MCAGTPVTPETSSDQTNDHFLRVDRRAGLSQCTSGSGMPRGETTVTFPPRKTFTSIRAEQGLRFPEPIRMSGQLRHILRHKSMSCSLVYLWNKGLSQVPF